LLSRPLEPLRDVNDGRPAKALNVKLNLSPRSLVGIDELARLLGSVVETRPCFLVGG
jgi:hypothetical protein